MRFLRYVRVCGLTIFLEIILCDCEFMCQFLASFFLGFYLRSNSSHESATQSRVIARECFYRDFGLDRTALERSRVVPFHFQHAHIAHAEGSYASATTGGPYCVQVHRRRVPYPTRDWGSVRLYHVLVFKLSEELLLLT